MSLDKQRSQSYSPPSTLNPSPQRYPQPLPAYPYSVPRTNMAPSFNGYSQGGFVPEDRPANVYNFSNVQQHSGLPDYQHWQSQPPVNAYDHLGIRIDTSSMQQHAPMGSSYGVSTSGYPTPVWSDITRSSSSLENPGHLANSQYATSGYPSDPYSFHQYGGGVSYNTTSNGISPTGSAELMLSPSTSNVHLSPHMSSHPTPPSPDTPGSQGQLPFSQSTGESTSSLLFPGVPRTLYSFKEQQQFFRDATTLLSVTNTGPFIPQAMYKPHTNSDRRRYVEEVDLEAPIYFWVDNPHECGILLSDAVHSRIKRLQRRDDTVFEGRGPSVSIRIEWPGYRQWSRQIPTKDFRSPPGPITRAKLAKNVAKCLQRFIAERSGQPLEDEADLRWRVGVEPNRIRFEDIVLVSIHHVSMGSWQPQLRLRRDI